MCSTMQPQNHRNGVLKESLDTVSYSSGIVIFLQMMRRLTLTVIIAQIAALLWT